MNVPIARASETGCRASDFPSQVASDRQASEAMLITFYLWQTSEINLVKWSLTKLTTTSLAYVFLGQRSHVQVQAHMVCPSFVSVCLCVSVPAACLYLRAACAAGFYQFLHSQFSSSSQFLEQQRFVCVSPTPPPLPLFVFPSTDYYQCWRVPGMGAHGWVAGICQPWEQYSI